MHKVCYRSILAKNVGLKNTGKWNSEKVASKLRKQCRYSVKSIRVLSERILSYTASKQLTSSLNRRVNSL